VWRTCIDRMVGTRASARARQATKDHLNSPVMADTQERRDEGEEEEEEVVEEEQVEEVEEVEEVEVKKVPAPCSKCDELKSPTAAKGEEASDMSGYLVGFAKRVVICTILVFAFKTVWPQVQNHFWPEAPVKEGKCYVLNDKSFKGHVSRGDHIVMMYAPWCGHCQKLKPTWDKIAKRPGTAGVKVSKVDCTASTAVCVKHDVKGYPTILYFRNGKKLGTYDGAKSEPELKDYIARMAADLPEPAMPDLESLRPKKPVKKPAKKTKSKKTEL